MLSHLDILDHVAGPVFVLIPDEDGRPVYRYWNRACEQIGNRDRQDVLGKTAIELFGDVLGAHTYDRHLEAMRGGKTITFEVLLNLGHDAPQEIQTTLSPVLAEDGTLLAVVGSSVVLSSLRNAQQREVKALGVVERARSEMEQYLAFAAHDLRAPMRRIKGLAEMIQEELPDDAAEAREIAKLMEQVSRKAQELISDVLRFSEAANAGHQIECFDLGQLARDIFTVLDPMGCHDLDAERGWLNGDRTAIQIVLRNLVDNAIKHDDKPTTHLRITLEDGPGGVAFVICDDGPGLPSGDLSFLDGGQFGYGNGFGLLGIRRLVEMRGGRVHAWSPRDRGTCFRIHLPGTHRTSETGTDEGAA
ncbi:PAS domain-containing sensor histidine kinase [Sagittula salina]|uniref:histidine kinase n=1 Tax=Sagittula salina TaxID=2820268 RepID=A0A940MTS7_9RHOB|nr:PAS domain-containing sensor histidine kinase [Sagittula salina]MBP0482819.1 PAS domain-containing sensor histidine kinase [Sagittula salina]